MSQLPKKSGSGRERVVTEWDSQFEHIGMKLRTITRDGWVCTAYEPGPMYEGTEGELYDLVRGPPPVAQSVGRPRSPFDPRRPDRRPVRLSSRGREPALAVEAPV